MSSDVTETALIGLGRAGCRALVELMPRRMVIAPTRADHDVVGPADVIDHPLLDRRALGRPRAEAVHAWAQARWPGLVELVPGPLDAGWPYRALTGREVMAFALDAVDTVAWAEVTRAALEVGVPLIAALGLGPRSRLGPRVVPGCGPCLVCADLRLSVHAPIWSGQSRPERPIASVCDRLGVALAAAVEGRGLPDDSLVVFDADGTSATHPVLRTSRCSLCRPLGPFPAFRYAKKLEFADRPSDPEHIHRVTPRLVSPLTGPIRSLDRVPPTAHDPRIEQWHAIAADTAWQAYGIGALTGAGIALDAASARASAVGEAVERLSVLPPSERDLIFAAWRDLPPDEAIDPRRFDCFASSTRAIAGFPYPAPSPDRTVAWVWGWSLTAERPVLVPASRAFAEYRPVVPDEVNDVSMVSGFAVAETLERATLHGLLEVLERDHFMIAWANQLPFRRLRIDRESPHQVGALVDAFAVAGLDVRCATLRLDLGVELAVGLCRSRHAGDPAVVISAAADVDGVTAARRGGAPLNQNK
ncbi:MAG: YcaO-like family protein [Acidobacteriota bacterium]